MTAAMGSIGEPGAENSQIAVPALMIPKYSKPTNEAANAIHLIC
jgi:hypothetical protein